MLREIRACPATTAEPMQTRTIDFQLVELQPRLKDVQQSTVHVSTTGFSQDIGKMGTYTHTYTSVRAVLGAEYDTCENKGAIDT